MSAPTVDHGPPAGWVALTFELAEGPLWGYQAALASVSPKSGARFVEQTRRVRLARQGLAVRR